MLFAGALAPGDTTPFILSAPNPPSEPQGIGSGIYSVSWWNDSFHSRLPLNITDEDNVERVNIPMDIHVDFEVGECMNESIRVVDPSNTDTPSQVWNVTYHPSTDFIATATVTFHANVSANLSSLYWIYYSDQDRIDLV